MSWISIGVAGTTAAIGIGKNIADKRAIKKNEANRPQYQIPDEIKQNLNQAQQQALQGLPEEQRQQFISNTERAGSSALQNIGSRKGGLSGVAAVNQQQLDAYGNLRSADSAARMQNLDKLSGARNQMAGYQDQAFQLNKINPYYEGIAARKATRDELFQNLTSSVGIAGQGLQGLAGGGQNQMANPFAGKGAQYDAYQGNQYGNIG